MNAAALAGLLVLALAWLGPLRTLWAGAFWAHMTMHMLVVAGAAPLLATGIAGTRLDPASRWPSVFAPIPVSLVELVVVWAFHTPLLHHAARHEPAMLVVEQGLFLLSGMALWLSVLGGGREARLQHGASRVTALLLTSMHMTLLGALLALAPRALFAHAAHDGSSAMTALEDQHLGGAIMLVAGMVVYSGGGLWLMAEMLRAPHARREVAPS